MNVVYQSLGLLLLVTGAFSATIANLGATCAIGDTCSVNGAVCDKTSLKCVCQFGYVQSGAICSRPHYGLCGAGMCKSPDKMTCDTTTSTCTCDPAKGLVVFGTGCGCPANQQFNNAAGKCQKATGQTCTVDSDCYTTEGMVCSSGTCACNTAQHYGAGSSGAYSCSCNAVTFFTSKTGGGCIGKVGAACAAVSDCVTGMTCTSSKCACDTALHYAAATDGAASCTCNAVTFFTSKTGGGCIGKVGAACAADSDCVTGMTCTSSKCACDTALHYAAATDGDASCNCATNYAMDSGTCKKVIGQTCAAGECHSNLICDTTCKCDANLHYGTGTTGGTSCTCNSATFFTAKTGGGCIGKVGAACSAASDCLTGLVCTGSKCACDTTLHYGAGANGDSSCTCNSVAFFGPTSGGCIGNVGATCSADSNCRTDEGMVCISGKCACDTTKKFVAGSNGASSCACATGYSLDIHLGNCAINVGGTCTRDAGTYIPCVDDAVCDRATDTCKCDSAAGYMATGFTCDACLPGFTMNNDDRCVADVNGFCIPSTQAGVCVSGATCFAGNSTLDPLCLCDSNQYDYKGSCSGAGGVVASLAGLLMALFMTSRLM